MTGRSLMFGVGPDGKSVPVSVSATGGLATGGSAGAVVSAGQPVLYRLTTDPRDPMTVGYLSGGKLYSDVRLQDEIDLANVSTLGTRITERFDWTLSAGNTLTPFSIAHATAVSTFHAVANHPGSELSVTLDILVASTDGSPVNADDYALLSPGDTRQIFTSDRAREQLTFEPQASLLWGSLRRSDEDAAQTGAATLSGYLVIVREV